MQNKKIFLLSIISIVVVSILLMLPFLFKINDEIIIHVIDVGQGSATLIEAKNKLFLIDFGYEQESFQTYFLNFMNTHQQYQNTIDYCILTHPDLDHLNNSEWIYQNFFVKLTYVCFVNWTEQKISDQNNRLPLVKKQSNEYQKMMNLIVQKNLVWTYIFERQTFINHELTLWNFTDFSSSEWNDYSPIITYCYGKNKYLLISGDASRVIEEKFVQQNDISLFSETIYLVGHHGSNYSSSPNFLQLIKPRYAFISAHDVDGKLYGHPNFYALKRIKFFTSQIYNTCENQTIIFTLSEQTNLVTNQIWKPQISGWLGQNKEQKIF